MNDTKGCQNAQFEVTFKIICGRLKTSVKPGVRGYFIAKYYNNWIGHKL